MADVKAIAHIAKSLKCTIDKLGMGRPYPPKSMPPWKDDIVGFYNVLVKSKELRSATRKLFIDGHYARAVEEAYKCLDNIIRDKSGLSISGKSLMDKAFSEKNPILKLNVLETTS